ncbi:precorrin-3B synthase [Rhizohabitans arisaemae]|uniref:precorrin-3B synthase n=1 Tax=Rhizohabitans arisaemae TaxID=2720610 RepID=UPI0024B25750|nr:precorrin-3B synthase [Rhizohabitans arisaemae]
MTYADFPGRVRRDACPGALQVHPAADGGLARIRVPGGLLTPSQLGELATAATGAIELTSRANVQIRGLRPGAERDFAHRMAEAGLLPSATHERVRNILASPLNGLAGTADLRPLVAELDRELCARPRLADLPGRFLFALDDGTGDVAGLGADVAAISIGPGFAPVLGGTDTGLRAPSALVVPLMLAAAEAFLAECDAQGVQAWRVIELPDGSARIGTRLGSAFGARDGLETGTVTRAATQSDPQAVPHGTDPRDSRGSRLREIVGVLEQADGRVALGAAVPLGRLTAAQARALAEAAEAAGGGPGGGEVRLTPWRGAVVPGLPQAEAGRWAARLAEAGLVTDPASPWIGVSACTGLPGCAKSHADVQADAGHWVRTREIPGLTCGFPETSVTPPREDAGNPLPGTLPVHWSGCARRCGRPAGPVTDVVATGAGYRVESPGDRSGGPTGENDGDGRGAGGLTRAGIGETAAVRGRG